MDLSTTYLGMRLPHPLVVGAGPLGDDLDTVKALEDAGAAMLVLRSLYEEEIIAEQMDAFFNLDGHSDVVRRSRLVRAGVRNVAGAGRVPRAPAPGQAARSAFRSSPRSTASPPGGWISYAKLLEEAGADGARAAPLSRRQRHDA